MPHTKLNRARLTHTRSSARKSEGTTTYLLISIFPRDHTMYQKAAKTQQWNQHHRNIVRKLSSICYLTISK